MTDQVHTLTNDEALEPQELTTEQLAEVAGGKVTMQDILVSSYQTKASS